MDAVVEPMDTPKKPKAGTAVAKAAPVRAPVAAPVSEAGAVMAMIERMSTDPTISIERVEQAFAFYEKVQASQARKAFDAAMAAAKAEIPVIIKKRTVKYGAPGKETTYQHEDLGGIAEIVDPILAKFGLSYRYRTSSKLNQPVSVTCIIAHEAGYFEETTLTAGRDDSGGKNAIQAIGSSVTYLQRYTLKAALGLAAAKDDDAKTAEATPDELATLTPAQIAKFESLLKETGSNRAAFLKIAQAESVQDILAKDFGGLTKVLLAKKGNAQ
jgi:hypothetical protein